MYEITIKTVTNTIRISRPVASTSGGAVNSVNGQTGTVVITAGSVGAAPTSHTHSATDITNLPAVPTKASLGLDLVDNTPDALKPVSTPVQTALNAKASTSHTHAQSAVVGLTDALAGKASANHSHSTSDVAGLDDALAGKASASHAHTIANVTGLQTALDAKTTPAYVDSAVAGLVASAPAVLNTLDELANALGDDPNFATTVANQIGSKADATHTHASADITDFDGAVSTALQTMSIDTLYDVNTSTATGGEALTYNGTSGIWEAVQPTGAVGSVNGQTGDVSLAVSDLADVDMSTPPTDGQLMSWSDSGVAWVPVDAPTGGGGGASDYDFVLDAGGNGTHTTWAGLMADLVAGSKVLVMPGTYDMATDMPSVANVTIEGKHRNLCIFNLTANVTCPAMDELTIRNLRINTSSYTFWAYGDHHKFESLYMRATSGGQCFVLNGNYVQVSNSWFYHQANGLQSSIGSTQGMVRGCTFFGYGGGNSATATFRIGGLGIGNNAIQFEGGGSSSAFIGVDGASRFIGNAIFSNGNSGPMILAYGNSVVDSNYFQDGRTGIYWDSGASNVMVTNNTFNFSGYGVGLNLENASSTADSYIGGNRFSMSDTTGWEQSIIIKNGASYTRIIGNSFEGGYSQITNTSDADNTLIANNTFRGAGTNGVLVDGGTGTVINGNLGY